MKKIILVCCCVLLQFSLVGCSKTRQQESNYQAFFPEKNYEITNQETLDNPLIGRWSSYSDVGHLIENTFDYENIDFFVTAEYCFNKDKTFTFKIADVNEEELSAIFMENNVNSPIETVQERIEITKKALYLQTDSGTYNIQGDTLILNGKSTLELNIKINSATNITLTKNENSIDLNLIVDQ